MTATIVALLVAAACVPSEDEVVVEPGTTPAEIARGGSLLVGIDSGFGTPLQGFTRELGELLAAAIGVEASFVTGSSSELLARVEAEDADVVFPSVAITEETLRNYRLTDPYYVTHQRLLVEADAATDDLRELPAGRVCAFIDPSTGVDPNAVNPSVETVVATVPEECVDLLRTGDVQAATATDAFLAAMVAELGGSFRMAGEHLTTEGYGAIVQTETIRFVEFIDAVFEKAKADGVWMDLYQRWMGPHVDEPVDRPPVMTVQEAAALYPTGT